MAQEKVTVVYVDDVPLNLKLFEATFRDDFDLILTEYPKEVLNILKERQVQVLISDQRMPEMTGTELLAIVAQEYPSIRRFLLTAFTDTETVIAAVNKGRIHGYINKPINADEIRQTISSSTEVYFLKEKNQQILEELEKANEELLNMDGLKSEIINSISNEISKPLNRIMGTLHLLKSKIEGDELTEVVNILDHSVFKLEQFSMLAKQISLIKSPGFKLKLNNVSIKQVIQFGSIETSDELKEQGIILRKNPEAADYNIDGDSALLVSCLVGLIRFAREHTESNGMISVYPLLQDEILTCRVEDQGANYTDALFKLLTNHFSAGDTSLNLTMGIGLAVSQMIMEAHNGNLIFEKTADNSGCMIMVFPADQSLSLNDVP